MAHFHIKEKKGRPYLYIRETARVDGKPRVVSQVYLGSPETLLTTVKGVGREDRTFKVQEYGALWAALQMDRDIDIASIIDDIIPRGAKETGPTVGEYFLYAVLNRMVEAKSKRGLPDWYRDSAIQALRPADIGALTSERYWAKWDRVSEEALDRIGRRFFERVWAREKPQADCVLFDTTNYYTFMASQTESELARRGKSKEGRHHLRQIGLGLLVSRKSRLPLYYTVYPGNRHDSKEFARVMDEMFGVVAGLDKTKERLTVVIDKGMNAEGNFSWIDEHSRVHFVTTYSTYFADDLMNVPSAKFEYVDTQKNRRLTRRDQEADQLRAYRTTGEFWGKERTVVVAHYPPTARKQDYSFQSKLAQLKEELLLFREQVNRGEPHWRNPDVVYDRYLALCDRLHLAPIYYDLDFTGDDGVPMMGFRKNHYEVEKKRRTLGRTIIVTDNMDWSTAEIVEAHLDRWKVESQFRQTKDFHLVAGRPVRHWTDSKIRCHLFTCVAALTYLRMLELRLQSRGVHRSAGAVMNDMRHLHSVLSLRKGERQPRRHLEQPSATQLEVLTALGHAVDPSGGLRPL